MKADYVCPVTGAHFDFDQVCLKMLQLPSRSSLRKKHKVCWVQGGGSDEADLINIQVDDDHFLKPTLPETTRCLTTLT